MSALLAGIPLLLGVASGLNNHDPLAPLIGGAATVALLLIAWHGEDRRNAR